MADHNTTEEERAKFAAEAEAQKALALKHAAETRKFAAEADTAEHNAAVAAINRAKNERTERDELAGNAHHHVYTFNESVTDTAVKSCITTLTNWMRTAPGCDIEIVFNSPGGSIIAGMALYDYIQFVRRAGHHVQTSAIGMAASMAGILLQAGDVRVMGKESYLLIHEAAFGADGKIGDVEDTLRLIKMMQARILGIFAARSKVSKRFIETHWRRKDWWMGSDDALKFG